MHQVFGCDSFAPSFDLSNVHPPSATSALEYTLGTLASRRLKNLIRTLSLRSNPTDALRKKTSQPMIEVFDGWEDVEEVVYHQGLSGVFEIMKIEPTSRFGIKKTQELVAKIETTWRLPMFTI